MTAPLAPPPFPKHRERKPTRNRVLLSGKLVFDEGTHSCDCGIRDLSPSGARLAIKAGTMLPKRFYLLDLKNGRAYDSEIVWRNAAQAGVRFHEALAVAELSGSKLHYLKRIYVDACPR